MEPLQDFDYQHPLATRYSSQAMRGLFSEQNRAKLWRKLWIYLADEERKLGLPIKSSQVKALEANQNKINLKRIRELELKLKHDVMSHLKAYGEVAKSAEGILHLGATSAFITDNADAVILRDGIELLQKKLLLILKRLSDHMLHYADLEMTGYTHFQPAQPVTLGKRIGLWAQDLLWDFEELSLVLNRFEPLGCKGTTGTQASFMVLFKNDFRKVSQLDRAIVKRMGFDRAVALSGQTLSRKADTWVLNALSNLASSLSKMSYDMRLLQHTGEVREPFGKEQIGSSAMAYKQNPMLAERISGLSRFLMVLSQNATWTHAVQWFERSLDDSSNRRLVIPQAFLTADALCESAFRLINGLRVDEPAIQRSLARYRPLFETEAELMEGTLKGGSRQELHEDIRKKMLRGKISNSASSWKLSGAASLQARNFVKSRLSPFIQKEWKRLKPDSDLLTSSSI